MGHRDPPEGLNEALAAARNSVRIEAASLLSLTEYIEGDLGPVVRLLANVTGHVVVAGLGKSGHVGKKMAATLASTGQPAFFVHATEALHGDSGMCTRSDVGLLISNSGETVEVCQFAAGLKSRDIPVVAMTRDTKSTLARTASLTLPVRFDREADPLGLAPTTSTIVMMAIGDALAAALMTQRGFSAADFKRFHPGGSLGKQPVGTGEL